jgi:hypothetical protein
MTMSDEGIKALAEWAKNEPEYERLIIKLAEMSKAQTPLYKLARKQLIG